MHPGRRLVFRFHFNLWTPWLQVISGLKKAFWLVQKQFTFCSVLEIYTQFFQTNTFIKLIVMVISCETKGKAMKTIQKLLPLDGRNSS